MLPWTAESAVTDDLARSLIEDQFPDLAPATIRLLGEGWDNRALLVNDEFVFRFPRRQVGADCLHAETRVLPNLAGRLPLPIPSPEFLGRPGAGYPWEFTGYRRLEGRTACAAALDAKAREKLVEPLAGFLAALHAIDAEAAGRLGAAPARWNRFDMQRKAAHIRDRLEQLLQFGVIDNPAPYLELVADGLTLPPPPAISLAHGDLYVRHLLVDEQLQLCGVIDWGDVHVGHPAADLAIVHAYFPKSAHPAFHRAYGPIAVATWRLARYHALYVATILAVYGHSIDDADLCRESRIMLGNLIA